MSHMMQPGIILLREGTDTSQGKAQIVSNINACAAVAETIKTTLGPRGMDKLIFDGRKVTISNDGATIMRLLDVVHPAAKTLVDISMSQDAEVGDGTTSVVLIAASILNEMKHFVDDGLHPQIIIRGIRRAANLAVDRVRELGVAMHSTEEARKLLETCAGTALNSKLISHHQDLFAPMVVDAVSMLDPELLDLNLVGIKKVPGGSVRQSFLVEGVAFKKTFSYAGFEQQPKSFSNPEILLLNVELELKAEKENAEVRITDPDQYQSIVDTEWRIIYDKLEACVASGAKIILSKLPIGDLATQYFADRDIFCAGRVANEDVLRVQKATGAVMQCTCHDINKSDLGRCDRFEERQVGDERYNLFTGCPRSRTATIVLRGGSEQFIDETHRSVHDALCIVKRAMRSGEVVAGGGAIEMEVSKFVREQARSIEGKEQLIMNGMARALEVIPRQLSDNAGFDATEVLNQLRMKHAKGTAGKWYGVDVDVEGITDTFESGVWEPAANKMNSFAAASEAACVILSIDETVRNPRSEQPGAADANGVGLGAGAGGRGGRRGKPVSAAMGGGGMAGMMGGGRRGGPRGVRAFRGRGGA
uniref:T-complex protein 1 subunit eta n=2 Tax=Phaeomonas parva TaxID=124430 RepID=A0A7S1XVR4_9STRA|mmetsp:Transcript_37368/g.116835  ORF Transcript_37368/g.116835 Transcript_37368/m.116835 type:complete len:590 (+) Transcript_37368:428-2197(+)